MVSHRSIALEVVRTLRQNGYEAYFAGGCVRDMLLHKHPKDFDVATSAKPHEVEDCFEYTVAVGKAFGVVRVRLMGVEVEIATFRADEDYRDGRRPSSIRFTSSEEDARRRDFTINGLFYDPRSRKLIDFVRGEQDIRKKILRAIGQPDERFKEDRLRLLRCIRFVAQLGFRIEAKTWKAISKFSKEPTLTRSISQERIREELTKLLVAPHRKRGLQLLDRSGLLKRFLPEVAAMKGVHQPYVYHPEGDVWVHTLKVIDQLKNPSPRLAWATLLHDVGKPPTFEKTSVKGKRRIRFPEHARVGAEMTEKILRRFKFSNDDRIAIVEMVGNHMTFKDAQQMRLATLKRLLARPTIEDELQLHRADCLGSRGDLSNYRFVLRKRLQLSHEEIKPRPMITGKDLIELGYAPGPMFGRILDELLEAQLEGKVKNREEARRWVKEQFKKFPSEK
jgi:poly(A) polymerase